MPPHDRLCARNQKSPGHRNEGGRRKRERENQHAVQTNLRKTQRRLRTDGAKGDQQCPRRVVSQGRPDFFPLRLAGNPTTQRVCTTFLFSPHCPALSCIPGFGATGALWAMPRAPSSDHKEGTGSEMESAGLVIAATDHTQVYMVCQVLRH